MRMKWLMIFLVGVFVLALGFQYFYGKGEGSLPMVDSLVSGVEREAPGFERMSGEWLNSEELSLDQLMEENKLVLVDFWTYSCINCQRTFPYLREWWDKYKDKGLVIVGVHTPEFEFEKVSANVADALEKYEIGWPVVQDNDYGIWRSYNNRYWPAKYMIVPPGKIVYTHFGEGSYLETEEKIREELVKLGYDVDGVAIGEEGEGSSRAGQSPESYLGWKRGQFGNREQVMVNKEGEYSVADEMMMANLPYLDGVWSVYDEYALSGEGAALEYIFIGGEANLVLGSSDGVRKVRVYIDDEMVEEIEVKEKDLYNLYDGEFKKGKLRLEFDSGVEVYAFTFGG